MEYAQKMQRCHEYVEALKEEQKKIQVFQRELPLCLELVTQGKTLYYTKKTLYYKRKFKNYTTFFAKFW